MRRKQPFLISEEKGGHRAPPRSSAGGLLRLPGEFGLICSQRLLPLLCHGFPPITRAVLLGSLVACTSLALVLCCIRPPISCPLMSRWPRFLAELPLQLDMPSSRLSSCCFSLPFRICLLLEDLQHCFSGINSTFAFSCNFSKLQHIVLLAKWDPGKVFVHELWL